ncbi:MAG: cysteine hydrolase [Zetaproteobacteria bacterium]|nr:cysteine hydrolase [Zetaproteobacteria bacterium]
MPNIQYQLEENDAVLFIEFQNEWLSKSGVLRNQLVEDDVSFQNAINHAKVLLNLARKSKAHVFHITLKPDKHYKIFGVAQYGLRAMIPHAGTWQGDMQDIHLDFIPIDNEFVIRDRTGASAFAGSMLDNVLRNNQINTLYLAGFATHVCVESTLREAHDKGYRVYVMMDATAAFNMHQQHYFESNILHHFGKGLNVSNLEEL